MQMGAFFINPCGESGPVLALRFFFHLKESQNGKR